MGFFLRRVCLGTGLSRYVLLFYHFGLGVGLFHLLKLSFGFSTKRRLVKSRRKTQIRKHIGRLDAVFLEINLRGVIKHPFPASTVSSGHLLLLKNLLLIELGLVLRFLSRGGLISQRFS